jgi:predicted PurR-regulated permease PerM
MALQPDASRRADEVDAPPRRSLHLPASTLTTILLVAAAAWAVYQLRTVIGIVMLAAVLAVAFDPAVGWLERHRVPRWAGATLVVFATIAVLAGFVVLCGSSLLTQAHQLGGRIQEVEKEAVERLPPALAGMLPEKGGASSGASGFIKYAAALATALADALFGILIAFILTIYFLIEGRRTWRWLVAYVPKRNRGRVNETAAAATRAVRHYVAGNVATSIFAAVCVFVALTILHVPAALLLAILAGVCDFVPVLGFIVSAVPAVALAMTVSLTIAVIVAAVYVGYHLAENYLIGPKVYGGQLRLSNLAVLLAFAVGARLFGVIGALLALPVAAIYPCIEDVWLKDYLARDAVETHRRIERGA